MDIWGDSFFIMFCQDTRSQFRAFSMKPLKAIKLNLLIVHQRSKMSFSCKDIFYPSHYKAYGELSIMDKTHGSLHLCYSHICVVAQL